MSDLALPVAPGIDRDFRLGRVFARTMSVLSRTFLPFFLINLVTNFPDIVLSDIPTPPELSTAVQVLSALLTFALGPFSQAIVLFAAIQELRGRPLSVGESVRVGLRRFMPLLGLAVSGFLLWAAGTALLIVPGVIVLTMLAVAAPVCVVEQLGPFRSMERSAQLTKGHRWKIFAALAVLLLPALYVSGAIERTLPAVAGSTTTFAVDLIWSAFAGTVVAVFVAVLYHDLRSAQDGVDTDQIARVFE